MCACCRRDIDVNDQCTTKELVLSTPSFLSCVQTHELECASNYSLAEISELVGELQAVFEEVPSLDQRAIIDKYRSPV